VVAPGVGTPRAAFRAVALTGVLQGGTTTVRDRFAGSTTARAPTGGGGGLGFFFLPPPATMAPIANRRISPPPTIHTVLFFAMPVPSRCSSSAPCRAAR
jgi:hypothetical protein